MVESGYDYLEIFLDEVEVVMNRLLVEIFLLGIYLGKYFWGYVNCVVLCVIDNVLFCLLVY